MQSDNVGRGRGSRGGSRGGSGRGRGRGGYGDSYRPDLETRETHVTYQGKVKYEGGDRHDFNYEKTPTGSYRGSHRDGQEGSRGNRGSFRGGRGGYDRRRDDEESKAENRFGGYNRGANGGNYRGRTGGSGRGGSTQTTTVDPKYNGLILENSAEPKLKGEYYLSIILYLNSD